MARNRIPKNGTGTEYESGCVPGPENRCPISPGTRQPAVVQWLGLVKPPTRPVRPLSTGTSAGVSDEELMTRFAQGEASAFDALFERHAASVHAYLSRVVGGGTAADDLAQATFLSVVRSRGRYHAGIQFRPWLYAIATNAARDYFRRSGREQLTEKGELPADAPADSPPPRDSALERRVRSALEQLSPQQREVIILNRFEGFSMAEIAAAVGASETAVKVRAHRGYERLRALLSDLWDAWKGEN